MKLDASDRFLRLADVVELTTYGKTMIYEMMRIGQFPARHRIGPNRVIWLESEIRCWMEQRLR